MENNLDKNFNEFFIPDGSLRDIYIFHTTIDDWKKFYHFLLKSKYKISYTKNGFEESLPKDIGNLFKDKDNSHYFKIQIENIIIGLPFFFIESEIELDIDPRDMVAEEQYKIIIEFMKSIGKILSKDVILTYENARDYIFFKIEC